MTPTNNSQDSTTESLQIPVPDYVRTHRIRPRLIASIIVIIWIVAYFYGLSLLKLSESSPNFFADRFLTSGTTNWGIYHISNKNHCIGFITSTLSKTPDSTLDSKIKGELNLNVYTKPTTAKFLVTSNYGKYNRLDSIATKIKIAKLELSIKSTEDSEPQIQVFINMLRSASSFSAKLPQPIFLTERGRNAFHLNFPPLYEKLLNTQSTNNLKLPLMSSFSLQELTSEAMPTCQRQSANASTRLNKAVFDLKSIFSVLPSSHNKVLTLLKASMKND